MTVFKDECTYTFDDQESEHGVDVCLKCFIGTSSDPQHDFTAQHAATNDGHTAFVNLRKRRIQKPPSSPQTKVAKLAIEAQEEEFELEHSFKTLASDAEADFATAIETVLNADSYAKAKQTEAWELELKPCKHVEELSLNLPERPQSYELLSHCGQCELNTNLWLCLLCGNLGCGRRQFDGFGGNNHGIDHYEQTKHPLAVKLGSITPDGHVDVFCYACDDDVVDPKIGEHLSVWRVDIATHRKTEKSMTELQLEQNMSWDFTSSDNGTAVSGAGFTGMKNLGNSCYMNAVMQCLFSLSEVVNALGTNDPHSKSKLEGPLDLTTQLRKLNDGLNSGRYEAVSPQMLRYLIGKNHQEFATARQQDAFEYLTYLLSLIEQKVPVARNLPAELFGFQSVRRTQCLSCFAVRYQTANEENISIPVPIRELEDNKFEPVEMDTLMRIYTQSETIDSKCPKCGAGQATSSIQFKSFPKYLIVNVRRFRLVNWVPQKVDVPVVQPETLRMDKYLSQGPQPDEDVVTEEDNKESDFKADPAKVEMLTSMGFTPELATKALQIASERGYGAGDFDPAVEILISGEAATALESSPSSNVDTSMLESMGFPKEQALAALKSTSSPEEAVEWLFNGNYELYQQEQLAAENEPASSEPKERGSATLPASYRLKGTVCHKGASVHVGHYVAAIRKEDETYLFNDEKVTKGSDVAELQKFAYIYIFERE